MEEQGSISSCARRDSSSLRIYVLRRYAGSGLRERIVKEESINLCCGVVMDLVPKLMGDAC